MMNKFDLYNEIKEIRKEIRTTREIIVRLIIFLIFLFSGLTSGYLFLMPLSGLAIVSEKNKRKGWLDGGRNTIAGAATGATLVTLFPFSLPLMVATVGGGAVIGAVSTHLMNRGVKKDIGKEFKECFNESFIKGLLKHLGYSENEGRWINENKEIILDADETWAEVLSIESNTALTLTAAYGGTGGSGAGSKVWGFEDKYLQAALTLPWDNNKLAAGIEVKWQTKSDDGTSITVDGSITGKTLEYE